MGIRWCRRKARVHVSDVRYAATSYEKQKIAQEELEKEVGAAFSRDHIVLVIKKKKIKMCVSY